MPAIASTDVTYSQPLGSVDRRLEGRPPHYEAKVSITFGNSTLTYPAGGIPLDPFKLGMPLGQVEGILVYDQAASVIAGVAWFPTGTATAPKLRGVTAIGTEIATAPAATTLVVLARGY